MRGCGRRTKIPHEENTEWNEVELNFWRKCLSAPHLYDDHTSAERSRTALTYSDAHAYSVFWRTLPSRTKRRRRRGQGDSFSLKNARGNLQVDIPAPAIVMMFLHFPSAMNLATPSRVRSCSFCSGFSAASSPAMFRLFFITSTSQSAEMTTQLSNFPFQQETKWKLTIKQIKKAFISCWQMSASKFRNNSVELVAERPHLPKTPEVSQENCVQSQGGKHHRFAWLRQISLSLSDVLFLVRSVSSVASLLFCCFDLLADLGFDPPPFRPSAPPPCSVWMANQFNSN